MRDFSEENHTGFLPRIETYIPICWSRLSKAAPILLPVGRNYVFHGVYF